MARRSDHSREEIREMALAAAEKIVSEQGYPALSSRKVAAAIGYTVGTLYLVFENLDDLILQVNARTLDRLHRRMIADQAQCNDALTCLLQLGHSYIRFADEEPHIWRLIFEPRRIDDGAPSPRFREKVAGMFSLVEERLTPLANHRSQREIAQAARALWGGVHGICMLAITDTLGVAGIESVQEITQVLMHNFLRGFITPSSEPSQS
jgi:AcrR family transcriptional regulator